jgi:hypothetical protein
MNSATRFGSIRFRLSVEHQAFERLPPHALPARAGALPARGAAGQVVLARGRQLAPAHGALGEPVSRCFGRRFSQNFCGRAFWTPGASRTSASRAWTRSYRSFTAMDVGFTCAYLATPTQNG